MTDTVTPATELERCLRCNNPLREQQIGLCDECIEAATKPVPFWTVAVYLRDRAYGGPEEGGWWYDHAHRVDDPTEYGSGLLPRIFGSEEAAREYAEAMQSMMDRPGGVNTQRRSDIGSVLSEGRYEAEVHEGYPPTHWPEQRPHYE